jgi:hypothetical protein
VVQFKYARIALCAGLLMSASAVTAPAFAQDADARVAEYSALLDQIEDARLSIAQREVMLANQQSQIEGLRGEIKAVPAVGSSLREMAQQMTNEIEKVIESDLPFRRDERFARLDSLRAVVGDATVPDSEVFRRALSVYDIEANYGNSISAYTGNNPLNPGGRLQACRDNLESSRCALNKDLKVLLNAGATLDDREIQDSLQDGNYVHFGRMSFIYLELDSSEGYRWSTDESGWVPLPSGDIIDARRAVRVARGESAPGVVTAPIRIDGQAAP